MTTNAFQHIRIPKAVVFGISLTTLVNPILKISWEHHLPQLNTQEPWHVPRTHDSGHAVESHLLSHQVE